MQNAGREMTMTISTATSSAVAIGPAGRAGWLLLTAALIVFAVSHPVHAAPEDAMTDADKTCLGCHGTEGMSKDLGEGKTLSLHIAGEGFAKSVHRPLGCAACHADIKLDKHPQTTKKIRSAREYSIAMVEVCRGCHDEVATLQQGSVHAMRLKGGNAAAPVCTDCHTAHAIIPKTAYDTCVGCHATAMSAHQKWLPNAVLHLEVVSCAACHAPAAQRMVDLRLYDAATRKWVAEKEGAPEFEKLARAADADGNGLDAAELSKLLAQINPDKTLPQKTLRGRIELRAGAQAHQLSDKTAAIRECGTCHRHGAEPFQKVTVSITSPGGKPLRYDAHQDVLSSVQSVESLGEFYAVGGTRNLVLDILFLLAVLGGLSVPIMHQSMKWLVRRQIKVAEANKAAAALNKPTGGAPGTGSDTDPPKQT